SAVGCAGGLAPAASGSESVLSRIGSRSALVVGTGFSHSSAGVSARTHAVVGAPIARRFSFSSAAGFSKVSRGSAAGATSTNGNPLTADAAAQLFAAASAKGVPFTAGPGSAGSRASYSNRAVCHAHNFCAVFRRHTESGLVAGESSGADTLDGGSTGAARFGAAGASSIHA